MTEQAMHDVDPAGGHARPHTAGFLGRERELAALRADLDRAGLDTMAGRPAPRSRVLLVVGRPGSGRTWLAEEFAAELLASGAFPDGLLRARLSEPDGTAVPVDEAARELLGRLGVPAAAGAAAGAEDELPDLLRRTLRDRAAVLLLDDVRTPEQLAELIPESRRCLVLAVARGPLAGVPDVRPCAVAGVDEDTAVRLLVRGAGPTRVAVDPRAAEGLARACGHLPGALLLAAGWLAIHPEAAVADAVRCLAEAGPPRRAAGGTDANAGADDEADGETDGEGEGAGGGGGGDGPAGADPAAVPGAEPGPPAGPVGPLERAFWLVHAALPPAPARLLRLLTLAPSGLADAHTAAALAGCSVETARTALADLELLGLVREARGTDRPRRAAGTDEPGGGSGRRSERHYQVPGCLAGLLGELLRTQERPAELTLARARMLERTVRRLRACAAVTEPFGSPARAWLAGQPGSLRFADRADADRWLTARLPGLLAATRLAVDLGELDTLARRLIAALSTALLAHRGAEAAGPELYQLHELVLAVADRQWLPRERAAALLNLGDLDARAGRHAEALGRYRAALEATRAQERPDWLAMGRAVESIGGAHAELGDWQRAADWYARALEISQSRDDLEVTARLHGRLGAAQTQLREWEPALRSWRAAAAAHRRRDDRRAHARSLAEVARLQERAGRPGEALRAGEAALDHAERAGDRRLQAAVRLRLAGCAERLGQRASADRHRAVAERLLGRAPADADPGAGAADRAPAGVRAPAPAVSGGVDSSGTPQGTTCETQRTTRQT